jgi:hypothetical protein
MSDRLKLDIVPPRVTVNEFAVEMLQGFLDKAKNGEISELVVAAEMGDGSYLINHTPSLDIIKRIGMIELCKLDWFAERVIEKIASE